MSYSVKIRSILLLALAVSSGAQVYHSNLRENFITRRNSGTFGAQYQFEVNKDVEYTYVFTNVTKLLQNRTARVVVETVNAVTNNPVLIMVRQKKDVMSWQHPLVTRTRMSDSAEYQKVSRTICPSEYYRSNSGEPGEDIEENLLVTASTSSLFNVSVMLSVEFVDDFYLSLSGERNITLSPSEPAFYGYLFPDDSKTVFLKAQSEDEVCTTISVQNIDCPIYDLEDTIKYEGQWETMMYRGGMSIKRAENQTGFFVVIVPNSRDDECTNEKDSGDKNGNTRISFKLVPEYSNFLWAILTPLLSSLILYILCGLKVCCRHCGEDGSTKMDSGREYLGFKLQPVPSGSDRFVSNEANNGDDWRMIRNTQNDAVRASRKKSNLYLWMTILAGTFFFVPAIQRVVTHFLILQETGNYDLCYYNFYCVFPYLGLMDFNHVYSNIGYILLGILFILITNSERKYYIKKFAPKNSPTIGNSNSSQRASLLGLLHEFGLYYAMGAALIMEGLLSGTYHVCPRDSNFQFDTTFMYVIALLCMVDAYKSYNQQNYANATYIFFFLAIVSILIIFENIPYSCWKYILAIFQIFIILLISFKLYYTNKISIKWENTEKTCGAWIKSCCSCNEDNNQSERKICDRICSQNGGKFMFLLIVNIINWIIIGLAFARIIDGAANVTLYTFIANLALSCLYPILFKNEDERNSIEEARPESSAENCWYVCKCCKALWQRLKELWEKLYCWQVFYLLIAIVLWIIAIVFFSLKAASWEHTPAISRNINQSCFILDFYDTHDVWHLLSSAALFFTFMVFLNLHTNRLDALMNQI